MKHGLGALDVGLRLRPIRPAEPRNRVNRTPMRRDGALPVGNRGLAGHGCGPRAGASAIDRSALSVGLDEVVVRHGAALCAGPCRTTLRQSDPAERRSSRRPGARHVLDPRCLRRVRPEPITDARGRKAHAREARAHRNAGTGRAACAASGQDVGQPGNEDRAGARAAKPSPRCRSH